MIKGNIIVEQKTNEDGKFHKRNERANIVQIILRYEMIYIVKFVVFLLIFVTVSIRTKEVEIKQISKQNIIGTFTFVLSTTIDCAVLARSINSSIKGIINSINLFFTFIMFLCALYVILIFMEFISISFLLVHICNCISMLCCFSPLLELGYDTILHMNNEKLNGY